MAAYAERRESGAPFWLWVPAWLLGPALLGLLCLNLLLHQPYPDMIDCADPAMNALRFVVGLALCLSPAFLIVLTGLVFRVMWFRPAALALGSGLAILLLAVVGETLAPRWITDGGEICKVFGFVEGTPIA